MSWIIFNEELVKYNEDFLNQCFGEAYAYEVVRLIQKQPLFLDLHFDRLLRTCYKLKFEPPKIEKIIHDLDKLVEANNLTNNNVKIAVNNSNYSLYAIASNYPSPKDYSNGVNCSLLFEERKNPEIKAFQSAIRLKSDQQIVQNKMFESVLVNRKGQITEGSRSNLFFIEGNTVFTAPDEMVLAGITRTKVLEICEEMNLRIYYKAVSLNELQDIEAAFICGTSPGVLPIANIDNQHFEPQNVLLQQIHRRFHSKYLSNFNNNSF